MWFDVRHWMLSREYENVGLFICKTKKYETTFNNFYNRSVQTKIRNVHTYTNNK